MNPSRQTTVKEGHPEVTFRALREEALKYAKNTVAGCIERLEVLKRHGLSLGQVDRADLTVLDARVDDAVDAAAMLLTAVRIVRGEAMRLPQRIEQRDERGLLMEMWA